VRLLRTLARTDLLILDDWGSEQFNAEQCRDLHEIIEDRYDVRSILITSQLPIERWYEVIGDPTLADAILDASSTTPTGSNSNARACASSRPSTPNQTPARRQARKGSPTNRNRICINAGKRRK
jgi:hypothetical protein